MAGYREHRFTLRARRASFACAVHGLGRLVRREHNAWLHLVATLMVAVTGTALRITASEWRWLVLGTALVWTAEAINTAIEDLCDRLHPGFDPAIGHVKDMAAGAVLVAAGAAACIGALTFLPYLPGYRR